MELKTIHADDRGSINLLLGDLKNYEEVTVFKTNAGYARGGCIHNINDEFVCVIEGCIHYYTPRLETPIVLTAGQSTVIQKSTPHYFVSITDSIVMEWGATAEEKKVKQSLYRAVVDHINDVRSKQ